MNQFDDSLFSENRLSFGHLLARDEELAIWRRKPSAIRLTTYQKEAPTLYATAQALFGHVRVSEKWGKVGRHNDWMTIKAGVWYENSRFKHRGERMRLLDVCKMLVGKTKAIGNTDVPTPLGWDRSTGWEHNLVTCLRLDVDMERAWRRRNLNAIAQQIQTEQTIARSLGLPYRCFRTGGKGHQIVIPLPIPTPHLLAWWWLTAFRTLLEGRRHPEAILDKDNLTSLLRLPGGFHQEQARLAMWINPDTVRLHDVPTQARMMGEGFRYPDAEDLAVIPPCEFQGAGRELLAAMAARGLDKHQVPERDRPDLFFQAIGDLPVNLAVRVFLHAVDIAAVPEDAADAADPAEAQAETNDIAAFTKAVSSGGTFDLAWARRVVNDEFSSGGFWDWLNMEGKRGILALWLVYGKDAEAEAIAMAQRVSCRNEAEKRKRIRTIKYYWGAFQIKDGSGLMGIVRSQAAGKTQTISGVLTPEGEELAAALSQALQANGKVQARNLDSLLRAIHILVLALEQSENGHIQISAQTLADSVCERWPETDVTRKDADRMLSWLTLDDEEKYPQGEAPTKNRPSCKLALLQLVRDSFRDKYGDRIVANEYRPGPVLEDTSLGQALKAKRREYRRQYLLESELDK